MVVAGTGYTGEAGLEIAVPGDVAPSLWAALSEAGVTPAGLGARDTLRLEAGLPLHGQELGPGITPLQAGLSWVVAFDKPVFRGRQALLDERDRGVDRRLRGISTEGRRPPRTGCTVLRDDVEVGTVSSGNFSPVLGHGIAIGIRRPRRSPSAIGRGRCPRVTPGRHASLRCRSSDSRLARGRLLLGGGLLGRRLLGGGLLGGGLLGR